VSHPDLPAGLTPGGRFDAWAPAPAAYVVADVDGTLVGPRPHASDAVVAAVAAAQQEGLAVGFATGRMRLAVEPLWEQLRAVGPHVLHNGGEVRAGGATIAAFPVAPERVAAALEACAMADLYLEVYVPDGYHVNVADVRAEPHWDLLGHPPLSELGSRREVDGPVLKVTAAVFDADEVRHVVDLFDGLGLRAGPAGSPLTPTMTYVNGTDPAAHKGAALTAAATHLGVDLATVVAVGDAPNDLPMFAVAGTSVAMADAPADVVAAAHLVAPSVHDDGVAAVLAACRAWRIR
jgi:Cof subfamily protein (haloacid dehalogenase superfamily)